MSTLDHVHPQTRRRAIWMLVLACALWGGSFPMVKALVDVQLRVDPGASGLLLNASVIWPRFALGALLMLPLAWRQVREGVRASELAQAAGLTFFLSGGLLLQVDGLRFTTASVSSFLTQSYVLFLPVWVYGRARQWPPRTYFAAMVLVVPGVGILAGLSWDAMRLGRGELETIAAAVFFAGQILWLERPGYRDNRAITITLLMFAFTALVFLAVAGAAVVSAGAPAASLVAPFRAGSWLLVTAMLTLFCTFGAFTLMNTWQKWVRSTEAGLIYTLEPVFTAVLALFLPGLFSALAAIEYANERVTWRLLAGGALILGANVLAQIRPAKTIRLAATPGEAKPRAP